MKKVVLGSLFLIAVLMLFACATPTPETKIVEKTIVVEKPVEKVVTVIVQPTAVPQATQAPVPTVDVKAIEAAWKLSSHSNDWGEGRGPNTLCARCHSPRNWDPKAVPGPAPNCVACKFPFDKEVRKPPPNTNVFIEQKDWKNIGCDVCHQVSAAGVIDPKPVMWNQATGKYDTVATTTELCEKCHTDSLGGSKHKMAIGGPAHTGQIGLTTPRPNDCTDCHNPHSQQASCTSCHGDVFKTKPNTGHIAVHAKIACDACHDARGLTVGPNADKTMWVAFQSTTSPAGGPPTLSQVTSHTLQKAVACTRCHYDNNPNKLRSMVTPTATRPPATPGASAAGATPAATPTR